MILIVLQIRVSLNKIDQSIDFDTWSISVIDMKKFLFFSWWNENRWKSYRFSLPLLWLLNSIFFLIFNQHFGNLWEFCCFCFYFFSLFIQIFKFKTRNLEIFFLLFQKTKYIHVRVQIKLSVLANENEEKKFIKIESL